MPLLFSFDSLIVFLTLVTSISGQSSLGREFSVAFPPMVQDDKSGDCAIIINARQTTNISITAVGVNIDDVVVEGTPYQYNAPCTQRTEAGVENKVYYVTSDQDISAMAVNHADVEFGELDATLVYPKHTINTEFYLAIFNDYPYSDDIPDYCGTSSNTASYYVISAFDDSTDIEIYEPPDYELRASERLNRYECFTNTTTISDMLFDFSGYYIKSNKPVSVSAGNACTNNVGSDKDDGGVTWSYMPPVQSLSSGAHLSYEIRDSDGYEYYTIMVLSTVTDTKIEIDGSVNTTDRGEKVQENFYSTWILVTCDKPCLVFQVNCDYAAEGIFMMHVTPVSAYNSIVTFSALENITSWRDEVIITVPSADYDVIVTEGLYDGYSWECKSLDGLYACQCYTYMLDDQAYIYSQDEDVGFSAVVYGQNERGEGFGYNTGFKASNDTITITTDLPSTTTTTPPPGTGPNLIYKIDQACDFSSSDGDDFTSECVLSYGEALSDEASSMLPVVNEQIGSALCPGKTLEDLELVVASARLHTSGGSEGVSYLYWTLSVGGSQLIGSVEDCGAEVAQFLADHNNWGTPLLPDEPGCSGVRFMADYFNTTDLYWFCLDSAGMAAIEGTLEFGIKLAGTLDTEGGEEIEDVCMAEQQLMFEQATYEQVVRTNSLMGSELCNGESVQLKMRSASLFDDGSQAASLQDIALYNVETMTFDEVYACADEVSAYLQSHDNWQQPIIGTPPGCPVLVFSPPEFTEDEQRWIC